MAPPSKLRRWFRDGSVQLGRWWGIPVRFHWTLPIGMLVLTRFRVMPVAWASIASLVLVHELGHAWFVRRYRARVESVQLNAFGGLCTYSGEVDEVESSIIAWGGVLAQSVLLVLALLLLQVIPFARHSLFALELFDTLVWTNLIIIGINLLPLPGFDGALAWKLPGMLWRRQGPTRPEATRMRERDLVAPPERFPVRARARKAPVPVDEADPPPLAPDVKAEMERIIRQAVKERVDKSRN